MSEQAKQAAPINAAEKDQVTNRKDGTETAANVAIVFVAVIASIAMIRSSFFDGANRGGAQPAPAAARAAGRPAAPAPGTNLALPTVDWKKSKNTLVLALAKGCRFCAQSAPFYRRLATELKGRDDLRLVAVFSHETDQEARAYLDALGVPINDVELAPLQAIGVSGTPTLILADNTGRVVESWRGAQDDGKQNELLERFKCETCQ